MILRPEQTIRLPLPHAGQRAVRTQSRRFNWLSAGRRWRKTTLAMSIMVESAVSGGQYIWGAPTFDQVRIGFSETKKACGSVASFNLSRMTVTFPSGGIIYFRSLDDPDNARGYTADGVVIDEAADVKPAAWYEVLRPMLVDTNGWAWAIGTPKGRNWFFNEHGKSADRDDSASWQVPTLGVAAGKGGLERQKHPLENPEIPFGEIVQLKETMPEQVFLQEILAHFIESSGGVFRRVVDAATATEKQKGDPDGQYVYGLDWGKSNDFTVIVVMDARTKRMVHMDRFNQIDYQVQIGRLMGTCERFRPTQIIAESNSIGTPIIEQLKRQNLPVKAFNTTNASKTQAIDALALAFEQSKIEILNDGVLINELQSYEMERLPSGMLRYSAPEGSHDDTVMALALAWQGCIDRLPSGLNILGTTQASKWKL